MAKCMYKCESDGTCARSTCSHHCQQVDDEICSKCLLNQEYPILSGKQLVKNAVKKALEVLPSSIDNREGRELLYKALNI